MSIGNALDAAQVTLSFCSIAQQKSNSHKKKEYSIKRHEEILDVHRQLHDQRIGLGKKVYKSEAKYTHNQHILSLDIDLLTNSRESERDFMDQRVQLYETVIFAAVVMFGSLLTVIIQGLLPNSAANYIIILFSLFSALSFFFLLMCIVICVHVTMNSLHAMYKKSNNFNKKIVAPILREDALSLLSDEFKVVESAKHIAEAYNIEVSTKLREKRNKMFEVHKDFMDSSKKRRDSKVDLQDYWVDTYEDRGKRGILFLTVNNSIIILFLTGTFCLLVSLLVLMYARWSNAYHSADGAITAVAIGAVILFGIFIFGILNWLHAVMEKMKEKNEGTGYDLQLETTNLC